MQLWVLKHGYHCSAQRKIDAMQHNRKMRFNFLTKKTLLFTEAWTLSDREVKLEGEKYMVFSGRLTCGSMRQWHKIY